MVAGGVARKERSGMLRRNACEKASGTEGLAT